MRTDLLLTLRDSAWACHYMRNKAVWLGQSRQGCTPPCTAPTPPQSQSNPRLSCLDLGSREHLWFFTARCSAPVAAPWAYCKYCMWPSSRGLSCSYSSWTILNSSSPPTRQGSLMESITITTSYLTLINRAWSRSRPGLSWWRSPPFITFDTLCLKNTCSSYIE